MGPPPSCEGPDSLHRPLGNSEFAFFRNSSTGLGDMFLHLALRAPPDCMRPERVRVAWAITRVAHPLLMSKVCVSGEDVAMPRFCFVPPGDAQHAVDGAEAALSYRSCSKDELIFNYMNGPRILSSDTLSYLVISHHPLEEAEAYHLLMCAPHFTGDGTSLHQSTHDLLVLLASPKSDAELFQDLEARLHHAHPSWPGLFPPAFESRLPTPAAGIARAICTVNVLQARQRELGDHVFPRVQRGAQRTRLVEHAFSEEHTRAILRACKHHGVSVNNALFALCNVAWARLRHGAYDATQPMMMYSAINLRPYLTPMPASPSTYWFLALTYFTVILPSFAPTSPATFWHRARLAKAQTAKAVKSPFLPTRALAMAAQRAGASAAARTAAAPTATATTATTMTTTTTTPPLPATPLVSHPQLPLHSRPATADTPSRALLGLSLIGNLDHIYTPTSYACPGIRLYSVTTASRQKAGGLLLLEHTFAGRLWLHLCWDEMGFEMGVVEAWWRAVVDGVEEFLK